MPADRPAEPWLTFLTELDAQLEGPADIHCIGGFVVSQHYGLGSCGTRNLPSVLNGPAESPPTVPAQTGQCTGRRLRC